jgi:hypothetical protein
MCEYKSGPRMDPDVDTRQKKNLRDACASWSHLQTACSLAAIQGLSHLNRTSWKCTEVIYTFSFALKEGWQAEYGCPTWTVCRVASGRPVTGKK